MRNKIIIFAVICFFCLLGCRPEPEEEPSRNLPEEMWGEWLRIDLDETWYITRDSIFINDEKSSISVTLKRQSSNVIQVTEGGRIYYLYASRTANASFSGRIAGFDDQASRSSGRSVAGGIGSINVVVENLKNGVKSTTTTDAEGEFTVDSIIPGDDYKITPKQGNPVTFTPVASGDDVGTITVVNSKDINFKVSIVCRNNYRDANMLNAIGYYKSGHYTSDYGKEDDFDLFSYGINPDYNFTISIQNTGGSDATAATYRLTLDPGLSIRYDSTYSSGPFADVLGTIEPGASKGININLKCNPSSISGDYDFKKLTITITDPIANRTWNDSVSLRFFKETKLLKTNGSARGMVISTAHEAIRFTRYSTGDGNVFLGAIVPKYVDSDYLFGFCGATANTEGAYSLVIADLPYQDDLLGTDVTRYEPNDTEETAMVITGSIRAYLHKNDVDYYRFRF